MNRRNGGSDGAVAREGRAASGASIVRRGFLLPGPRPSNPHNTAQSLSPVHGQRSTPARISTSTSAASTLSNAPLVPNERTNATHKSVNRRQPRAQSGWNRGFLLTTSSSSSSSSTSTTQTVSSAVPQTTDTTLEFGSTRDHSPPSRHGTIPVEQSIVSSSCSSRNSTELLRFEDNCQNDDDDDLDGATSVFRLAQPTRSYSTETTSKNIVSLLVPTVIQEDEPDHDTCEVGSIGHRRPLISVIDDDTHEVDMAMKRSNRSTQNDGHNETNERKKQPFTGLVVSSESTLEPTWMTAVVERPTRREQSAESDVIKSDALFDVGDGTSTLECVKQDSIAMSTATMARHTVSVTLQQLRQTMRSHWTRVVTAAQSDLNTTTTTTTTLLPASSDVIQVIQWEAILDAILAVAAMETSCGGGTSKKQQALFTQPEFWLARHMLQHWLTHGFRTHTDDGESTESFWSRILCLPLDNASTLVGDSIVTNSAYTSKDVTLRHRQLAVMNLLYAWLCSCCTESHTTAQTRRDGIVKSQLVSLVVHVLPRLIRLGVIALDINGVYQRPKRQLTVLEQRIIDVAHLIVILASKTITISQTSAPPNTDNTGDSTLTPKSSLLLDSLAKHAESFHVLLKAQQVWLRRIDCQDVESLSNWDTLTKSDVRQLCRAAVVVDWIDVYAECCQVDDLEFDVSCGVRDWCGCINGRSTIQAAGFAYTIASVGVELTKNDVLDMLASFDPIESNTSRPVTLDDARMLLRCLVAWISHRARHLKSLEPKDVQRITSWIFSSPIVLKYPSLTKMTVVALKALWSSSNGIPCDVSSSNTEESSVSISTTFRAIFDTISSMQMDNVGGTSNLYLIEIATQCALIGGPAYEDFLVSEVPTNNLAVDILIGMARLFFISFSGESEACCGRIMHDVICQVLLQRFASCLYIRSALREMMPTFKHCSVCVITLPILRLLADPKNLDMDSEDKATLVSILVGCMNHHLRSDPNASLQYFFVAMAELSEPDHSSLHILCTQVGQSWRRSLMSEVEESEMCFARAFVLISQELLRTPTDVMPISLLKLIACHSPGNVLDSIPTVPLVHAVTDVLQLAYKAMAASSDCLLTRLAPLLILRCLPSDFFRRTIHEANERPTPLLHLVSSVGGQLALRLSISDVGHTTHVPFSREEKCLAAEIACCLIPLCNGAVREDGIGVSGVSCYNMFFYEAFKKLQESIVQLETSEQLIIMRIKAAISAVCVVSNVLQRADCSDSGVSLRFVTSTLLQITSSEWNITHPEAEGIWQELEERIVEFWASCKFRLLRCQKEATMRSVPEQSVINHSEALLRAKFYSVCDAVNDVWGLVQCGLETGAPPAEWIHVTITPPTQLILWRSLLLVCQRCNISELADIARTSLPWMVFFLENERTASFPTHELIIAAAMQVLFVMVTRTRSMEYFGPCAKSRLRTIYGLFQFIKEALKRIVANQGGRSYQYPFRCAVLTLFLSVLLVDSDDTAAHLTMYSNVSEVSTMLRLVRQLSTTDFDHQIQLVSNRILDIFQHLETFAVVVTASSQ